MVRKPRRRAFVARYAIGSICILLAFGLTVLVAYIGTKPNPQVAVSVLLVVLAGLLQILGAGFFHSTGRADPGLARASVRRLVSLTRKAEAGRLVAEEAFDLGNDQEVRQVLGRLSVEMSWLQEGLLQATEDWYEFHAHALTEISEATSDE